MAALAGSDTGVDDGDLIILSPPPPLLPPSFEIQDYTSAL